MQDISTDTPDNADRARLEAIAAFLNEHHVTVDGDGDLIIEGVDKLYVTKYARVDWTVAST